MDLYQAFLRNIKTNYIILGSFDLPSNTPNQDLWIGIYKKDNINLNEIKNLFILDQNRKIPENLGSFTFQWQKINNLEDENKNLYTLSYEGVDFVCRILYIEHQSSNINYEILDENDAIKAWSEGGEIPTYHHYLSSKIETIEETQKEIHKIEKEKIKTIRETLES